MSDYPPAQNRVIYQQVVRAPSNGLAVTALVLGIVAIAFGVWIPIPFLGLIVMFLAFLPALLAVVFGHLGFRRSAEPGAGGRGVALAGLILGYLTLAISAVTTVAWILLAASAAAR
jgi:hypothetical protein